MHARYRANVSICARHAAVARAHRAAEDPGPEPHIVYHSDDDYAAAVATILAAGPASGEIWLFAYGPLIWKPEVGHHEEQDAVARGWHRSFCFRVTRFRGDKDKPGLMMALDRGGQCKGVAYRLDACNPATLPGRLFRREFTSRPANSMPRWIRIDTDKGPLTALALVMNRNSPVHTGRLAPEAVADMLASACGHWGSGADYLFNTVTHLEARGIRDSHLWRLQHLVAERLTRGGD